MTKAHIASGSAQAVIVNSGNANTCNIDGEEKAEEMCRLAAKALGMNASDIAVASTGVIGEILRSNRLRQLSRRWQRVFLKAGMNRLLELS